MAGAPLRRRKFHVELRGYVQADYRATLSLHQTLEDVEVGLRTKPNAVLEHSTLVWRLTRVIPIHRVACRTFMSGLILPDSLCRALAQGTSPHRRQLGKWSSLRGHVKLIDKHSVSGLRGSISMPASPQIENLGIAGLRRTMKRPNIGFTL